MSGAPQQMGYPQSMGGAPQQMGYPPMGGAPQQMGGAPQQMGYPQSMGGAPQQMGYSQPTQNYQPNMQPPPYSTVPSGGMMTPVVTIGGTASMFQSTLNSIGSTMLAAAQSGMNRSCSVRIKTCHGKWVCAEQDGRVVGNRDVAGEWETWHMHQVGDRATFKSYHGRFLCADGDNLVANREHAKEWEHFVLVPAGHHEKFHLRTAHNKYICAEQNLTMVANRNSPAQWETFHFHFL